MSQSPQITTTRLDGLGAGGETTVHHHSVCFGRSFLTAEHGLIIQLLYVSSFLFFSFLSLAASHSSSLMPFTFPKHPTGAWCHGAIFCTM